MQERTRREEAGNWQGDDGRQRWRPLATTNWRAVAIGAAALALGLGALAVFWILRRPLALLVLGVVIAQALAPLVERLATRMPRVLAVVVLYVTLLLIIAAIIWFATPRLWAQAQAAIIRMPYVIDDVQAWLVGHRIPASENLSGALSRQMSDAGPMLLRLPLMIFSSAVEVFVVVFISVYWLILAPRMWQFALSLVPEASRQRVGYVVQNMGWAMGGYLRGTAIDGVILGVTAFVALSLIGVNYPLVLGLLTALLEFVPVLGATISAGLIILVALSQSLRLGLIALIIALFMHQVENHILVPNIMHSQTNISPLVAVWAIFAGATVGGLLGALVAIPLASALQVFFGLVVVPAIRRRTGAADSAAGPSIPD